MDNAEPLGYLLPHLSRPLYLIDIGARWGVSPHWNELGENTRLICFEPDEEECRRLVENRSINTTIFPIALSSGDGKLQLTVTRDPACSSVYPPVEKLYKHYAPLDIITPERTIDIPCRTLDGVLDEMAVSTVDAIKLDTQGSELDILRGAEKALRSCSLIDVEVEFNELYQQQPLFCDVDRFLRDHGFVLWRISDLVHYSPSSAIGAQEDWRIVFDPIIYQTILASDGQLFWAQVQYVRAEFPRTGADYLDRNRALAAAAIVASYDYWDLALELIRKSGDKLLLKQVTDAVTRSAAKLNRQQRVVSIQQLQAENTRSQGENAHLQDECARLQAENARLTTEMRDVVAQRDAELQALLSSLSWRVTSPLRCVKDWLSTRVYRRK